MAKTKAERTSAEAVTPIAAGGARPTEPPPAPPAQARMVRATKWGPYRNQRVKAGQTFRLLRDEDFNPDWMEEAPANAPDTLASAGTGQVQAPGGAPERPPRKARSSVDTDKDDDDRTVI